MPIVSISEFARMKGWVHSAVIGKIKRGVISKKSLVRVEGKKKLQIDSDRAELDIEFYGDESKTLAYTLNNPESKSEASPDQPDAMPNDVDGYRDVKISTEELKARKLELEIATKEERLLDADEVRKRIIKLVSQTKDAILNIPSRVAPMLVSITDPVEMETKLLQELNEALSNLSRLSL